MPNGNVVAQELPERLRDQPLPAPPPVDVRGLSRLVKDSLLPSLRSGACAAGDDPVSRHRRERRD
jgi:hypothetical protein